MSVEQRTTPLYITRFFAAYGVLLFHFLPKHYYSDASLIGRLGEAVNYFFFISGFVMIVANKRYVTGAASLDEFSRKDFWIKRTARIYPMYILALLLCVSFHYLVKRYDESIPYRFPLESIGIQRWIYAGSINFPAWSVSCEFLFYFLFPFLLPWIIRTRPGKLFYIFSFFLLISLAVTYIWGKWVIPYSVNPKVLKMLNLSIYNHPLFKFSVFLFGNLCGVIYLRYNTVLEKYSRYTLLVAIATAASCLSVLYILPKESYFIHAGLLTPFYFIFTLALCSLKGPVTSFLSNPVFVFLGEISYGIYILQVPVLLFFEQIVLGGNKLANASQFFIYTLVLTGLCAVLFYVFEKPLKKRVTIFLEKPVDWPYFLQRASSKK